jgi:hypothetical protein
MSYTPSIKDIVGMLWIPCPKCHSAQCITEWGEQVCKYEKCNGHKWIVEFNFETAGLMLKQIENCNKSLKPITITEWVPPILQKTNDGWICVPQPYKIL